MLEHLFGSKTRVRLLRLFLNNQKDAYYVRELTRKIQAQINSVRNELENLIRMGVIVETEAPIMEGDKKIRSSRQRKYYRINTESVLFPELRALFLKARVLLEKNFVRKVSQSGSISYFSLTGYFVGIENAVTDIFIVGRVNRTRLVSVIRNFEREIGREINYTVMTPQEYKYRRDVTDKFLYSILEGKKIAIIDKVQEKISEKA